MRIRTSTLSVTTPSTTLLINHTQHHLMMTIETLIRIDNALRRQQQPEQISFTCILFVAAESSNNPITTNTTLVEENNSTFLEPIAEALVRYRRHPPRTIVKHIIRPKRVKVKRFKKPKIKYSFAEPPTTIYYKKSKPSYSHAPPTYDSSIFEDFSHINVESADFDLPPSSYETQSMDFDLYKHYEEQAEHAYKEIEKPSYSYSAPAEVSHKEVAKIPSYSYPAPKGERKPHTQYGVPTEFTYSTGYDKPTGNSYSYEEEHLPEHGHSYATSSHDSHGGGGGGYSSDYHAPSSSSAYEDHSNKIPEHAADFSSTGSHGNDYSYHPEQASSYPEHSSHPHVIESGGGGGHEGGGHDYQYSSYQPPKEEYNYSPPQMPAKHPPRIPATKYGVPDLHLPVANFNNYNKYSVPEHKPSSSYDSYNNKHHFAEPPDPQKTTVEITYSPSYEINVPPKGHYYPAPAPEHPESSYHPNQGHQEVSDSHQPSRYEPAPPQDLPIDQNHQHPPYDYPKSSYEVPIYDPIPFDSSSHQKQEVYPPQPYDINAWQEDTNTEYEAEPNNNVSEQRPVEPESSQEMPHGDVHSAGTRPHSQTTYVTPPSPVQGLPQRTRKRKRTKGGSQYHSTTLATTKHILDVPELEEAFEKEKQKENKYLTTDPDIDESHKVVKEVKPNNHGPWNPMRIRTSTLSVTKPSTTLAINQNYHHNNDHRNSYSNRYRTTTTTTTTTTSTTEAPRHYQRTRTSTATTPAPPSLVQYQTNHLPKIEIVSIEKSRSRTYYDGILSTPKIYNTNFVRNRYRTVQQPATSTIAPHLSAGSRSSSSASSSSSTTTVERFPKRTTKNVFDTTIFKSPLNDPEVYRNLPKNHKLF
ncbi:uncharacterized protein LOC133333653 [Musca vetustissima]|uniref:uncharacterized protein LOC133333653 n=1 Tax=Musca vetustissima TaxID=27455 RepID=UPI002AB6DF64|nr:uncharacterized protein LOC133333653 [Musca vetustissima]